MLFIFSKEYWSIEMTNGAAVSLNMTFGYNSEKPNIDQWTTLSITLKCLFWIKYMLVKCSGYYENGSRNQLWYLIFCQLSVEFAWRWRKILSVGTQ